VPSAPSSEVAMLFTEVRGIGILRSSPRIHRRLNYAGWIDSKMSLSPHALTTFFNQ
jgi:hypothetical protein